MDFELAEAYTVHFRLNRDDILAEIRSLTRPRGEAVTKAIFSLVFFAGTGSLISVATRSSPSTAISIGAVLGGLVYWRMRVLAKRRRLLEGTRGGYFDEQTLTITPNGLELVLEDGRRFYCPWTKITKIEKSKKVFIINAEDRMLSFLVPIGAFNSNFDADLFMGVAQEWRLRAISPSAHDPRGRGSQ